MGRLAGSLVVALAAATATGASAVAPSFDCAAAEGAVEEMICADAELAALDRKMDQVYRQSVAAITGMDAPGDALPELRAYQRGWTKGRNDCWKATDQRACVVDSYRRRISSLQAAWNLAPHDAPIFYICNGNPADEIVATFYESELPAVRLERGDSVEIAVLQPSGSGSRYEGGFGISFWIKSNEARVNWPEGNRFTCRVR